MHYQDLKEMAEKHWLDDTGFQLANLDAVEKINCSKADREFLLNVPMPSFVAPNICLHFMDNDDIVVQSDPRSPGLSLVKIAEGRNEKPFFYSSADNKLYVGNEEGHGLSFLASSFQEFFLSLIAYAEMVDHALQHDEDAFVKNRIDDILINGFQQKLIRLDPALMDGHTFWSDEISRLRLHSES